MRVTALFAVIVGLLGGVETAQGMTRAEFREARSAVVVNVNKARDNRCRYPVQPHKTAAEVNSYDWNLNFWKQRLVKQRAKFSRCIPYPQRKYAGTWRHWNKPSTYGNWMCIHSHEGAWNDPNSPYYGGLQMDISFQRAYGWRLLQFKGTADHWNPMEQMWVAEHARTTGGRGFYPWPLTARYCGLI
jgi:hypothetical protein